MECEYDVAFYEALEEEERGLKEVLPGNLKCLFTWKTIQESGHKSPPARVASVRTQSELPPGWVPPLEVLVTRSTGYDHISEYLSKLKTPFKAAYLPDYAARVVAEQAMLLWTSCLRGLKDQMSAFIGFERDGLTGRELKGMRILVAGVGRIGSQIVDVATGLGMKPMGFDLARRPELESRYGLQYMSLEEALPTMPMLWLARFPAPD